MSAARGRPYHGRSLNAATLAVGQQWRHRPRRSALPRCPTQPLRCQDPLICSPAAEARGTTVAVSDSVSAPAPTILRPAGELLPLPVA